MNGVIANADCLLVLKDMPDACVDMCMTSPPYWAQRDYGTEYQVWGGRAECTHQWNVTNTSMHNGRGDCQKKALYSDQEPIPDKRISYASCVKCGAWKGSLGLEPNPKMFIEHLCDIFDEVKRVLKPTGTCFVNLGDKYGLRGLHQIPSRFGIAMADRGWIVPNECVWHKPNIMPQSVKRRFTVDFEKVFFFAKTSGYYFEQQLEPLAPSSIARAKYRLDGQRINNRRGVHIEKMGDRFCNPMGRNKRCVWSIKPRPCKYAHFATYPEELCETPIKAGCPVGGTVLDPFAGTGTTLAVAKRLGRRYVGCELNPEYCRMIEDRLKRKAPFRPA
jgi:site-specific DNA-methyltransferase (cytosine-N4-specific)